MTRPPTRAQPPRPDLADGRAGTADAAADRPVHLIANGPALAEDLARAIAAHRALAILRLLAGPLKGGANDRLLLGLLGTIGLRCSSRELEGSLHALARIGAVELEPREGLLVVALRPFGTELAQGVERADEVEPPPADYPF